MKNFKYKLTLSLLAVSTLITLNLNSDAFANLENSYILRPLENQFPVPKDDDVITTFGYASKNQLPSRKFNFLVWNLHKGADDPFRFDYITLAFGRDIIMAQEVFLDENMLGTFRFYPLMLYTNATSFFSGKEKIRTGVANISPARPIFTKFLRTETTEPVVGSPKVALINSYPIRFSTKKLTVVNIHGINFVTTKGFRHELNRIYETIKDIPSPMVFAGDFNTWNKERLSILAEYSKKLGMSEAAFYPDDRMKFNGNPLDHFLHTRDLKITSARVDGRHEGSDHKPLEVEVEYVPQQSPEEIDQSNQDFLAIQ